jgi:hypothetical protein
VPREGSKRVRPTYLSGIPTGPLPIRFQPFPGEALESYLGRLGEQNGISRSDAGWPFRDGLLRHGDLDWKEISARTGQPVTELRNLTPFKYPASVVGTGRPFARDRRWRAPELQRLCPECEPRRGRRTDWDLLLHLCCLQCRQLLRSPQDLTPYPVVPTDDPLIVTQSRNEAGLRASQFNRSRQHLNRLGRLVRLASLSADAEWPPVSSDYLTQLRVQCRWERWTLARPTSDPVAIAVLVSAASAALGAHDRGQAFARAAWSRVEDAGIVLGSMPRSLPGRSARPRNSASRPKRKPARQDKGVFLPSLWRDAANELAATGYEARNIPLILMGNHEFLPPLHELRHRHELARNLARLIDPSCDLPAPADLRLGPHTTPRPERSTIAIRQYVEALRDTAPADYSIARAALSVIPRTALRATRLPEADWPLAAAWMWTHHTRGPLVQGKHQLRMADLLTFHQTLEPEVRLRLHDLGRELINTTETSISTPSEVAVDEGTSARSSRATG